MNTTECRTLPSRKPGEEFVSDVTIQGDTLSILSGNRPGWRSAHRDYAARHFGTRRLWCVSRVSRADRRADGSAAPMILTVWKTDDGVPLRGAVGPDARRWVS